MRNHSSALTIDLALSLQIDALSEERFAEFRSVFQALIDSIAIFQNAGMTPVFIRARSPRLELQAEFDETLGRFVLCSIAMQPDPEPPATRGSPAHVAPEPEATEGAVADIPSDIFFGPKRIWAREPRDFVATPTIRLQHSQILDVRTALTPIVEKKNAAAAIVTSVGS